MLILHSNLILKSSFIDGFSIRFNDDSEVAYFLLGHPIDPNTYPDSVLFLLTVCTKYIIARWFCYR